jgi:hypothetical protein
MCHTLARKKNWTALNRYDELAKCLKEKECLLGFTTPYCNFDPTFKVARQEGYEYNPKRSPSYTDRILFKTTEQLQPSLRPLIYEPIQAFTTSDHKPIRGAFDIKLNESLILGSSPNAAAAESTASNSAFSQGRLHLLVSSMRCQVDQDLYDKRRGSERRMPHPFISFVSTPPEALRLDSSKKKKSKFPETTVISEAFKPNWKGEQLYFKLQTHNTDGSPIDLAGALMHVSVFDKRSSDPKLWGSVTLSLAKLIENAQKTKQQPPRMDTKPQSDGNNMNKAGRGQQPIDGGGYMRPMPGRGGRSQGSGRVSQLPPPGRGGSQPPPSGRVLPPPGSSARGMQKQGSSGIGLQQQSSAGRVMGSGRGGPQPPGPGRGGPPTGMSGRGGSPMRHKSTDGRLQSSGGPGWAGPPPSPGGRKGTVGGRGRGRGPAPGRGPTASGTVSPKRSRSPSPNPRGRPRGLGAWAFGKPSKAMQSAYTKEGLPEAVAKASKSLLKKKMAREGTGPRPAKDLNILSLHLSEEPLLDGASKVGSITLSIDAWWMDDSDLPTRRQSISL